MRSYLQWVDQVNYTAHKALKVLHFVMRVLKKGNKQKNIAYTLLVCPILEYVATGLDPSRGTDKRVTPSTKASRSIC
jgi:hypothetical protein